MLIPSSHSRNTALIVMLPENQMSRQSCKRSRRERCRCRAGALIQGTGGGSSAKAVRRGAPGSRANLLQTRFRTHLPLYLFLMARVCAALPAAPFRWAFGLILTAETAILYGFGSFHLSGIALMRLPRTRVCRAIWNGILLSAS